MGGCGAFRMATVKDRGCVAPNWLSGSKRPPTRQGVGARREAHAIVHLRAVVPGPSLPSPSQSGRERGSNTAQRPKKCRPNGLADCARGLRPITRAPVPALGSPHLAPAPRVGTSARNPALPPYPPQSDHAGTGLLFRPPPCAAMTTTSSCFCVAKPEDAEAFASRFDRGGCPTGSPR
jgi:hypothetical protein